MTDANVYPVTAAFEAEFEPELEKMRQQGNLRYNMAYPLFETMKTVIGEYEGGHADGLEEALYLDDVVMTQYPDRWKIKAYACVCDDILQTFMHT
jgi:hypothetical protein